MVALVLAISAMRPPALRSFISSARNFGRQFHALKSAQSISPIERIVLSLAPTS